jgi:hypothetical protein
MGTLVLEDLNLVSLHALLKRLPAYTIVSDIVDVIGDREIFSGEQADRIVVEMGDRAEKRRLENNGIVETVQLPDHLPLQITQTEEIYRILGEFHKRLLPGHDRKGKFPMHQVGDDKRNRWVNVEVTYGKRVKVFISQPDSGQAFWPRPEIIDGLNEEQFYELLGRTRDWVFTEYRALDLKG